MLRSAIRVDIARAGRLLQAPIRTQASNSGNGSSDPPKARFEVPIIPLEGPPADWPLWKRVVLTAMGVNSRESRAIRAADPLYKMLTETWKQPEFLKYCHEENTFPFQFQLQTLHMWLIISRLRHEGKFGRAISQEVFDTLFEELETVIKELGVSGMNKNKEIDNLNKMFYGSCRAYDAALHSDALLASALWRNMFQGKGNAADLFQMVGYLRREHNRVSSTSFSDFINCRWSFGPPPPIAETNSKAGKSKQK